MKLIINRKRKLLFLLCLLYWILIIYGYKNGIGIVYAYTGIVIKVDIIKVIVSLMTAVLIIFISCFIIKMDYLGYVNFFFLVFSYIPTIALWGIKEGVTWDGIFATFMYGFFMLVSCFLIQKKQKIEFSAEKKIIKKEYFNTIGVLIILSFLFALIFHQVFAAGRWLLSFNDSLDVRLGYREMYIPTLPKYLFMILGGALLPAFFSIALAFDKYLYALLSFFSSYLLYMVIGMKTWMVIYPLIIGLWIISRWNVDIYKIMCSIIGGICFLWIIGIISYSVFSNHIVYAYLHRIFSLLAELHYYYFDFLKENEFLFLRESVGRFVMSSPYVQNVSRLIGLYYYNSQIMNCTNGTFSDFFVNFGYFGLIVYPFMIFGCMAYLGKMLRKTDQFIQIAITTILLNTLYQSTFFTWLLTGGYIFTVITMKVYNRFRITDRK